MKQRLSTSLYGFLFFCVLLFVGTPSRATHIVAADLNYKWISGNTYQVTVVLYGDCAAAVFPGLPLSTPQVCVYNGDVFDTTLILSITDPICGTEVTPVICPGTISQCTDPTSLIPGVMQFTFTDTITLPGASHFWRFIYNGSGSPGKQAVCPYNDGAFVNAPSSGRNTNITNIFDAGNSIIQLIDTLDNTGAPNSNPELTQLPTAYYCINTENCYSPRAKDILDSTATSPTGDSLAFALVDATVGQIGCSSVGGSVTYTGIAWLHPTGQPVTGATPLQVDSANQFSFDPKNGQICFTPNRLQLSDIVYNIREFRNGALVGTCQREMTILIQACANSTLNAVYSSVTAGVIKDSTDFQICSGTGNFSITILPKDNDSKANITVVPGEMPTGASFSTTGNGTPNPLCTFSWSTNGLAPGIYTYMVTFTDDHCPYGEKLIRNFQIIVSPPLALSTNVNNDICNTGKGNITVITSGGISPYSYQWSDSATGAVISGLSAGTYSVAVSDMSGCKNSISASVGNNQFQLVVTPTVKEDICRTSNGKIAVSTDGGTAPYSYLWSNDSAGYTVTALPAGVYSVNVTDANGCKNSLSVNLGEGFCPEIVVHDVITPNGDGFNDVWVIEGIENYPKNMVQLFDKWGNKLYEHHVYNNDWNGRGDKGELLPDGTYYYVVKLNAPNAAGGADVFSGALLIKR